MSANPDSPKILMLATGLWVATARIALALTSMGCSVDLMSPRKHPARATGIIARHYVYNPIQPLASIRAALDLSRPHVVIPADELAVLHLEEMLPTNDGSFKALLERSLGGPLVLPAARSRMTLLNIALMEGVAIPETLEVPHEKAAGAAIAQLGSPFVLKADATAGGRGVRIVANEAEAHAAFRAISRPPSLPRAAWRSVVRREHTHFRAWAKGQQRGVTAQRFIAGAERTAMAVAHQGELLALTVLEVLETWNLRGPSSVVRVIDDPVIENAVRRIVRHIGASGFCGFDFIVAPGGAPLLIEMNPRPTQLTHIALGPHHDLIAAYVRALLGREVPDRPSVTDGDLIALFPHELERDPQSPHVHQAFHDVPWESPTLMRRLMPQPPALITNDPRWKG